MSKQYNIRWRDSDLEELRKSVDNFNKKIYRLGKKYPEIKNALPERMSAKQMEKLIQTRQDFKREINALKRFTSRDNVIKGKDGNFEGLTVAPDNEYNLKITKWQKNEMTRRTAYINKKRKDRYDAIKEIEMTSRDKPLGYKLEAAKESIGMGSVDRNSTEPMNAFTPSMNRTSLNVKFQNILAESQSTYWDRREQIMKATYLKTIQANFNNADISDIVDAIYNMDFKEFYERFLSESGRFEWTYPDDDKEEEYAEALRSIWL